MPSTSVFDGPKSGFGPPGPVELRSLTPGALNDVFDQAACNRPAGSSASSADAELSSSVTGTGDPGVIVPSGWRFSFLTSNAPEKFGRLSRKAPAGPPASSVSLPGNLFALHCAGSSGDPLPDQRRTRALRFRSHTAATGRRVSSSAIVAL